MTEQILYQTDETGKKDFFKATERGEKAEYGQTQKQSGQVSEKCGLGI
jgi:hypothetical protein